MMAVKQNFGSNGAQPGKLYDRRRVVPGFGAMLSENLHPGLR
jgi:hypothetical protein